MPHRIWSQDVRRVLYTRLVELFGPLDEWTGSSSPGGNLDGSFDEFCEAFCKVVGAKSAVAVKHQIRFAMPESLEGSKWESGHVQTAILNKAAALECGFFSDKHLPASLVAVGPKMTVDDLAKLI